MSQSNTDILTTHGLAVLDEGDKGVTIRGVPPRWFATLAEFYQRHNLSPLGLLASGTNVWSGQTSQGNRTQTLRFPAGTYKHVRELLQSWQVPHWL
jgi:hypothetical protein